MPQTQLSYQFKQGFATPYRGQMLKSTAARLELQLDPQERLVGATLQAMFTPESLRIIQAEHPALQHELQAALAAQSYCLVLTLDKPLPEVQRAAHLPELLEAGILDLNHYEYRAYQDQIRQ